MPLVRDYVYLQEHDAVFRVTRKKASLFLRQLARGRDVALRDFGPMAYTFSHEWNGDTGDLTPERAQEALAALPKMVRGAAPLPPSYASEAGWMYHLTPRNLRRFLRDTAENDVAPLLQSYGTRRHPMTERSFLNTTDLTAAGATDALALLLP